ncbi:MAG: F0F1 ATP synthase subunit gamma, partial [Chloroflexota bacterium]|nr:F0F1 ATP synthase subunit gamma [Chloroflexota bacterium]
MDDVELAETRLDNIRAVKPILSALRTISLGSWQSALRRRDYVRRYEERLAAMLPVLVPHVQPRSLRNPLTVLRSRHDESSPASARVTALVIGSERGLCGRFNQTVVERAERYLVEQEAAGAQI